ncbi:Bifunctional arginine demethylase and lysyl-hydroxylase JMJD6, partial [Trichinella patagoniensis]
LNILKDKTMVVLYAYLIALLVREKSAISCLMAIQCQSFLKIICFVMQVKSVHFLIGTHAWNALVFIISVGVWFLPDPPENLVKLKPSDGVEVLQKPGETIFMPGRWWHVVLNLHFPVAVTHKITTLLVIYQSHGNAKIFRSRPKLAAINAGIGC